MRTYNLPGCKYAMRIYIVPQPFAREWLRASHKFSKAEDVVVIIRFSNSSVDLIMRNHKRMLAHESAAERCAGGALVPLVRFANGAELREARQCVQSNREQEQLTFARTAVLPAQRCAPYS